MAKDLTLAQINEMLDTQRCPLCNDYIEDHDIRPSGALCEYHENYLTYTFNINHAERELWS